MPCDYDLGQAGQGFLGSLTNFWPCQQRPVQANCRPNFSAFPCQALPVLTPASRGLSRPCRPFMFFAFPSQFWPQPTVARPGQAGSVAAASPGFFNPLANMAKAWPQAGLTSAFRPGFDPGLPRSGQVPDARNISFKMCIPPSKCPPPSKHSPSRPPPFQVNAPLPCPSLSQVVGIFKEECNNLHIIDEDDEIMDIL